MSTTFDFTDKVAFITGAGVGIGRAIALAFAAAGADVALASIDEKDLYETARLVQRHGRRTFTVVCDVSDAAEVAAAISSTVAALGSIDIGINNAGIEQAPARLDRTTTEDFDRLIDVNLKGVFLSMKHQITAMKTSGGGSIVNISSGAGVIGIRDQAVYAATKHAVLGLTKCAALENAAEGIQINAICPGIIDTPMMRRFSGNTPEGRQRVIDQEPIGRMGKPKEVAAAALWLCSDLGAFTIGHALVIDGGQTVGI